MLFPASSVTRNVNQRCIGPPPFLFLPLPPFLLSSRHSPRLNSDDHGDPVLTGRRDSAAGRSTSFGRRENHGTRTRSYRAGWSLEPGQPHLKCWKRNEYQCGQENTLALGSVLPRHVSAARRTADFASHLSCGFTGRVSPPPPLWCRLAPAEPAQLRAKRFLLYIVRT